MTMEVEVSPTLPCRCRVSPVFKGMFYGPMKETAEEIKVEDNFEAFETMIKYIYQAPSSEPFKVSTRAQLGL